MTKPRRKMKHTKVISLVLITTMTVVTLSACSDQPELPNLEGQKIFSSVKECKESGERNCDIAFKNASISHLMKAPRYLSESECEKKGHEKCDSITLDGATVWLPEMVGFMANNRPIYLQKYDADVVTYEDDEGYIQERPLTADEKKEREVVAGPSYFSSGNHSSIVVVGGWYPTPGYYSYGFNRGGLSQGIHASNARIGLSPGVNSTAAPRVSSSGSRSFGAARAVSARGGFGRAGGGFGSGG